MTMQQEYKICGVSVLFPCKPYPSQFSMMDQELGVKRGQAGKEHHVGMDRIAVNQHRIGTIIKGIQRRQNCLIESPTGSGKSLALLCSALAWQSAEKAKQESGEAEETESKVCTCAHVKVSGSSPVTATPGADESEWRQLGQLSNTSNLDDDDDDFKTVGENASMQGRTNNRKKHIVVVYDSDEDGATATSKLQEDNLASTLKTDQDKSAQAICTCNCDIRTERRPKAKIPKIYFGTRTHKQVAQIIRELRKTGYHDVRMTVLGSREHTCIHPQVSRTANKSEACKELLNEQGCHYKDCTPRLSSQNVIKSAGLSTAWDLEDLVAFSKTKRACPYFLSRALKEDSDLIICPYNYLVDPIVRDAMQINLKGHVIILDEAHNIEDSAREAASQTLTQDAILKGIADIESLMDANVQLADHSKLRTMLKNLDTFIETNKSKLEQKEFDRSYKIWNGFHIVAQLETLAMGPSQFPEYKAALASIRADVDMKKEEAARSGQNKGLLQMKPSTQAVLEQMFQLLDYLYRHDLKYVDDYRACLSQMYSYVPVAHENQWLNSRKAHGGRGRVQVDVYTLNFWCMNPGVAFSDFSETRSVILTSGTLSPMSSFQSELGLEFKIRLETNHVIEDCQVWVGTLGQGPSGSTLQAVFRNLETFAFQDELGHLVLKVCQIVPHGVLCFLPSYNVLDKLMTRWESTGLKRQLEEYKLVIREPKNSDKMSFEEQLNQFYQVLNTPADTATDTQTGGAIFFAVCRGKVSEGLDFADNFARAVITVGVPYPNFKDIQVDLKKKYNDQYRHSRGLLSGSEWYEIQAFRALNQALGRCIRHRHDWGALIIVDDRFVKAASKYCQGLSKWVRNKVHTYHNCSGAMESLSKFTSGQMSKVTGSLSEVKDNSSSLDATLLTSPDMKSPRFLTGTRSSISSQPVTSPVLKSLSFNTPGQVKNMSAHVKPFAIFNMGSTVRTRSPTVSSNMRRLSSNAGRWPHSPDNINHASVTPCSQTSVTQPADNTETQPPAGNAGQTLVTSPRLTTTPDMNNLANSTDIASDLRTVNPVTEHNLSFTSSNMTTGSSLVSASCLTLVSDSPGKASPDLFATDASCQSQHALHRKRSSLGEHNKKFLFKRARTENKPAPVSTSPLSPPSSDSFMPPAASTSVTKSESMLPDTVTPVSQSKSMIPDTITPVSKSESIPSNMSTPVSRKKSMPATCASPSPCSLLSVKVRGRHPGSPSVDVSDNPHPGCPSVDVSSKVQGENERGEDRLHIRRKNFSSKKKCLSRSETETQSSEEPRGNTCPGDERQAHLVITCCVCGSHLLHGVHQSDFQEQRSVPSFLRDGDRSCSGGSLFFPGNTSCSPLYDLTDCMEGADTKYNEQEEICVQFLYCKQCREATSQASVAVGAEVKLAAGSGARFSKGQMWLFLDAIRQTQEH